jgi:hypothetical protein
MLVMASCAGRYLNRASTSTPSTLVAAAAVLAASGVVLPAFSPVLWAGVLGGTMYVVGLAVVGSVARQVLGGLGARWAEFVMGFAGIGVLRVIVGVAAFVERRVDGAGVVMGLGSQVAEERDSCGL